VVRDGAGGLEVLLVHRPKYDDWSFPKGKVDLGESDEECAVREVAEETGLVCVLEHELPSTSYTGPDGRPKQVRYWRMRQVGGALAFQHEVDQAVWVGVDEAAAVLTHPRDAMVVETL
jgi:8-oxo-dGTP diphosphatase